MTKTVLNVVRPDEAEARSGAARVFTFFRDQLLAGDLKAGDRLLAERDLALTLGVSRPVLREALRSLAMLGLLDIRHGRGAFVRSADASVLGQALTLCLAPEPNILGDVLQARIAIECQANARPFGWPANGRAKATGGRWRARSTPWSIPSTTRRRAARPTTSSISPS